MRVGQRRKSPWYPASKMAPDDPCFLVFTLLCSPLPHCTGAGLYDQYHTTEVMTWYFKDYVVKHCGFFWHLFALLSQIIHSERSKLFVLNSSMESHLCPTVSKELRPVNNHRSEHRSLFYSPSKTEINAALGNSQTSVSWKTLSQIHPAKPQLDS